MRTLELFAGTRSFSKVANSLNHSTFTIDNDPQFKTTITRSVLDLNEQDLKGFDFIWSSPPCTAFSVASIGKHWEKETREPKTKNARLGLTIVEKTIKIMAKTKPKYWFIENPRGMLRKLIDPIFKKHGVSDYIRHTITYCQYGDNRMKPTDIWTNCKEWTPRPSCKNGSPCHIASPRGSTTGTQGLKGAINRSVIPPDIFIEIFKHIDNAQSNHKRDKE